MREGESLEERQHPGCEHPVQSGSRQHRRAWEILNRYDRQKYHSYAEIIAAALIALADDGTPASYVSEEKMQEIVAGFTDRLSETVIEILRASIPAFLAGFAVQAGTGQQTQEQPECGKETPEYV